MRHKPVLWFAAAVFVLLSVAGAAWAAYTLTIDQASVSANEPPYATLVASGQVRADSQPAVGVPVALRVDGPTGALLAADQVATAGDGRFSAQLPLPVGTPSGTATLVAAAAGTMAQQQVEIPALPTAYYGSVKDTAGQSVASGKVEAYIEGRKAGEIQFSNGFYGGSGGLDPKLVVSGTEADCGKPVSFKVVVGGQALDATPSPAVTWQPGDVRRVDLTVAAAPPPPADTTPPAVVGTYPVDGATGVAVDVTITVTFSENVQPGTAYDGIAVRDEAGIPVGVSKNISGAVLSIKPSVNLAYSNKYIVAIPAGAVKDLAGNSLAAEYSFSFTTQAAPVTPAPGGGGGGGGGAPPPARQEGAVTPAAGGTVSLSGVARVEVPANAVETSVKVTVEKLTSTQVSALVPADLAGRLAGDVVDIRTDVKVTFKAPVKVTLHYGADKVSSGMKPAVYYYHEGRAKWLYLGGTVDAAAGTVTVEIAHLTKFAVFAAPVVAFTDTAGHWAERQNVLDRLVGLGVVAGYPDGTFKPDNNVTRAEFAKMLAAALDLAPDAAAAAGFVDAADIPTWAKGYVGAAVKAGLIKGYEDKTFRADRQITRAELAVMVARALKAAEKAQLGFKDAADIPSWAADGIAQAVARGIIKGYEDNTFRPANPATRAETVAMTLRLLNALGI